jgi:hypothetical protein
MPDRYEEVSYPQNVKLEKAFLEVCEVKRCWWIFRWTAWRETLSEDDFAEVLVNCGRASSVEEAKEKIAGIFDVIHITFCRTYLSDGDQDQRWYRIRRSGPTTARRFRLEAYSHISW